jgi:hypothetical protein
MKVGGHERLSTNRNERERGWIDGREVGFSETVEG